MEVRRAIHTLRKVDRVLAVDIVRESDPAGSARIGPLQSLAKGVVDIDMTE